MFRQRRFPKTPRRVDPDVADVLARSHGCPDGCLACRLLREDEDDQRPELLPPWKTYVNSDAARRHAINTLDLGMTFPTLSRDPLVQYVLEEAVLMNTQLERAAAAEHQAKLGDAMAEAKRMHKETFG